MKNFYSIRNALEYIDRNLDKPISLEELAQMLHFSPFYFHRLFTVITGRSLAAYIRDRRLEQACVALCSARKTITEICYANGFNSQASFSRAFKKKYGISPQRYRKQNCVPIIMSVEELISSFEKQLESSADMTDKISRDIEKLTQMINLDTENAGLYNERGEFFHALKKHHEAKADFIKAVELEPANSHYLMNLGNTCQWLGDYAEAVIHQKKAIEHSSGDSKNVWYYNYRGNSYQRLCEYDKAITDYSKAIELDDTNADYYYNRGVSFNYLGDYQNAVANYTAALELSPDSYVYYGERGVCLHSLGKYDAAIQDYTESYHLNPHEAVYLAHRGLVYTELGEYEKALSDFNAAIETDGTQGRFFMFRAENFVHMKRPNEALSDMKTALKLTPTVYMPLFFEKIEIKIGHAFIKPETEFFIASLADKIKILRLSIKNTHAFEIPPVRIFDSDDIDEGIIAIFVNDITVWQNGDLLAEDIESRADIIVNALCDLFI